GADVLTGGGSNDIFRYTSIGDSAVGNGDTITDFNASNSEDIFLDGLLHGAFSFLGADTNAFTGTGNTEAHFNDAADLLSIDVNGDGTADMEITLTGMSLSGLSAADFTVTSS
ncbi:MAG: type I secretion C-terminal target domain-containing protein, partial [Rhodospirillales bacterium]